MTNIDRSAEAIERSTTLSPLRHRLFALLCLSGLAAGAGSAVHVVGAAWRLTELDQSADIVALTQTAASLPIMLLALPAGALADMGDRRRLMLLAQTVMLIMALGLVFLAMHDMAAPWSLLALTFALASGTALFNAGLQASLRAVVPRHELAAAVSLNILAFNVARTVGPALGGLIVAAAGATIAFTINTVSIAIVIALLLAWRPPPAPSAPRRPMAHAIADGLKFIVGSPQMRTILFRTISFTTAGSAAWALMPLVSRDLVGGGSVEYGLMLGALGAGAVLGAATSTWFRQRLSSESIIRAAGLIYGVGCVATALRPGLWPTLLILSISGAGWVQALSGFSVAGQLWSPAPLVGRVTAAVSSLTFGGIALGSWVWGSVANAMGVATALAASGAVMIALPLLGLLWPMPRHEHAPAS